jgi:RND family efflux transporter MFP subunit
MNSEPNSLTISPPAGSGDPLEEKELLRTAVRLLAAGAVLVAVLVAARIWSRHAGEHRLEAAAKGAVVSRVAVIRPQSSASVEELVLPANVRAYVEAPIYARTHGYLKHWYFDIGAHVRRGQLLAEIETPEEDQQLAQARADLEAVRANAELAARTAERWENLLKKNAVSKQETDQALSDFNAKRAAVAASEANVRRLEQLQDYEKVYAPFDGIVTARDTDVGALIDGGSSPRELFHLAAVEKLRVYAAVPEVSAAAVRPGGVATLATDLYPNRVFRGTITRDSGSIDPATRTLNVEVDIDNASGELLPGAYGFVHIALPGSVAPLTIPANTLIFRAQGLQVAVVRGGHAALVPITIGRDFGGTVEVTSGIDGSDSVILDPSDSLVDGTPVAVDKEH